jgi:hypothetical protein
MKTQKSFLSLSQPPLSLNLFLSPKFKKQKQSAIRAAMRTDDSFYQETYINANVNGVRPYWKNLKVREFLIAVFVFDTSGGGKSENGKEKTHAPGGGLIQQQKTTALLRVHLPALWPQDPADRDRPHLEQHIHGKRELLFLFFFFLFFGALI